MKRHLPLVLAVGRMPSSLKSSTLTLLTAGLFALQPGAQAQTWNLTTSGNWNVNGNWTPNTGFPNAVGASAVLGDKITAASTISLGANITVGSLQIDSANSYTINGGSTTFLNLEASSGSAQVTVVQGSHRIQNTNGTYGLYLRSPVIFDIQNSSSLALVQVNNGGTANSLTKSGSGTLIYEGQQRTGSNQPLLFSSISVTGGTLQLGNNNIFSVSGTNPSTAPITLSNNAKVTFNYSYNSSTANDVRNFYITPDGGISGAGSVEFTGDMRSSNYFINATLANTGTTTVKINTPSLGWNGWNAGAVVLRSDSSSSGSFSSSSVLNFEGGRIILQKGSSPTALDVNLTVAGLSGTDTSARIGNNTGTNNKVTINVAENESYSFAGAISGDWDATNINNTMAVEKGGKGTQVFTNANTYTGGTTISDGELHLGSGGSSGSIVGNVNTTATTAALVFNRSDVYNFNGSISGNGQVHQAGAGTTVLTANHTYTGKTRITAGTLLLNATSNNISSSSEIDIAAGATLDVSSVTGGFVLASGQTLKGNGSVVGALGVGSGATLSIGSSPGTMEFLGGLSLANGSASIFEINGLTSGFYDLALGGAGAAVDFGTGATLQLIFSSGFDTVGTVKIFDFDSYAGAFGDVEISGLASGFTATFNSLDGVVSIAAVPEPGTSIYLGLGIVMLLGLRGRLARSRCL